MTHWFVLVAVLYIEEKEIVEGLFSCLFVILQCFLSSCCRDCDYVGLWQSHLVKD